MSKAYRRGISEAQANALALENRGRTYASANAASFVVRWNSTNREPRDLRHAVELVRRAYRDEVPTQLHKHSLADDGTPAMTAKAEAYIFGSPTWTDAGRSVRCTCGQPKRDVSGIILALHDRECPALGNNAEAFYLTPFRATLSDMEKGDPSCKRRAAIVRHVAFGQGPVDAAVAERCHPFDAKIVAEDALRSFLRRLSDIRVTAMA